jgi:cytochrome P450
VGVELFYALPEEIASKGLADYLMLRRKLPDEIFDGRRTLPSSLFRHDDVASYLVNLDHALEQTVAELGPEGIVDLFDLTRRLGHRMGLASRAGPGSAQGDTFDRLVAAFDTLVGSDAFALPLPMLVTAFGHGRHSCPAQPFSLAAITAAMNHLLGRYAMTPQSTSHPSPVPAQIGGVARAAEPCAIRYCATR